MGYKKVVFNRDKLYEQVWEKPMIALAKEYGLSDVWVRKICRDMNIPLPPQGYHLRKYKGRKTPLPLAKPGQQEYVTHVQEPSLEEVAAQSQPAIDIPEVLFEQDPKNRIKVPQHLSTLHPLVEATKRVLKKAAPDNNGRITSTAWQGALNVMVCQESKDRALRIMNALVKALNKRGYTVSAPERTKYTLVKVLGEEIGIRLEERSRKVLHEPTREEALQAKKQGWKSYNTYDYFGTGELALSFSEDYTNQKICKDHKSGALEEKLNDFVAALVLEAMRRKRVREERAREERLRQERDRRRWQRDDLIRKEKEKVGGLRAEYQRWYESQRLRAFIHAVREDAGEFSPESDFAKWLVWASLQADRLDPLKESPPSILDWE
jgi:hypothetical protein